MVAERLLKSVRDHKVPQQIPPDTQEENGGRRTSREDFGKMIKNTTNNFNEILEKV